MGENTIWSTGLQAAKFAFDVSSMKTCKEINSIRQTLKNNKGIGEVMKASNRSEERELGRKLGFSSVEKSKKCQGLWYLYTFLILLFK